jgi:hypothetical protein
VIQLAYEVYGDFHSFRHTYITNIVAHNKDLKIAQQLARHDTIQLTANYAKTDKPRLIEAIRRVHEKAELPPNVPQSAEDALQVAVKPDTKLRYELMVYDLDDNPVHGESGLCTAADLGLTSELKPAIASDLQQPIGWDAGLDSSGPALDSSGDFDESHNSNDLKDLSTPAASRTRNLRIRSPLLYPVELRAQGIILKAYLVDGDCHVSL